MSDPLSSKKEVFRSVMVKMQTFVAVGIVIVLLCFAVIGFLLLQYQNLSSELGLRQEKEAAMYSKIQAGGDNTKAINQALERCLSEKQEIESRKEGQILSTERNYKDLLVLANDSANRRLEASEETCQLKLKSSAEECRLKQLEAKAEFFQPNGAMDSSNEPSVKPAVDLLEQFRNEIQQLKSEKLELRHQLELARNMNEEARKDLADCELAVSKEKASARSCELRISRARSEFVDSSLQSVANSIVLQHCGRMVSLPGAKQDCIREVQTNVGKLKGAAAECASDFGAMPHLEILPHGIQSDSGVYIAGDGKSGYWTVLCKQAFDRLDHGD